MYGRDSGRSSIGSRSSDATLDRSHRDRHQNAVPTRRDSVHVDVTYGNYAGRVTRRVEDQKERTGDPDESAGPAAAQAEAGSIDWAWRRRIRNNRHTLRVYRSVVFLSGLVVVVAGLVMVPLPGPGWLVVILGLAIWASEFDRARRVLHFVRDKVRAWNSWVMAQAMWIRFLIGTAAMVFVAAVVWLSIKVLGVPPIVPDSVADLLRAYLGL